MNVFPAVFALSLALLFAAGAHAQAPAGAPAGTTGLCKDGSYTSAEAKRGACRGHQGVKDWYAANAAPAAKSDGAGAGARASSSAVPAATPAAAPSGSTGLCKDGSYTDADSRKGACRGHKGVKEWYGASVAAAARPAAPPVPPPAAAPSMPAAPPATAAPQPTTAPPTARKPAETDPADRAAAPGGGAGKVWVNLETKVYHCPSDRYYGKTKQGEYLSETEAKAKGNHAAHGKACTP